MDSNTSRMTNGNKMQKVFSQAKKTFARIKGVDGIRRQRLEKDGFSSNLQELAALMKSITARDLGVDQSSALSIPLNQPKEQPPRAPVTYIDVHQDQDVSMGIFIINPSGRMPLHNHPQMHGVLKVVHGTVEVSCFNRMKTMKIPEDLPESLVNRLDLLERGIVVPTDHPTRLRLGPESAPLILFPNKDNYHEIHLVGNKPAAFFDILAPPYNHEMDDDGDGDCQLEFPDEEMRDCAFFQPLVIPECEGGNRGIVWLSKLRHAPSDYYCDKEPYKGLELMCT